MNLRGIAGLIVGLAVMAPAGSQAAPFTPLSTSSEVLMAAFTDTVSTHGGYTRVWIGMFHPEGGEVGKAISLVKVLYESDCRQKRLRHLASIAHDKQLRVMVSSEQASDWEFVAPNSKGATIQRFACAADRSSYPVYDLTDAAILDQYRASVKQRSK